MLTVARIRMPENGEFHCRVDPSLSLLPGERCVAELEYGQDIGTVQELYGAQDEAGGGEKAPSYRIVRKATPADEAQVKEREALAEKARKAFMLSAGREKGHVKILHVRFSLGGERLFIRYSAQMPVDLRRFTGQLQRDFKTRVDLWQVGVRDEAALVGCLGPCGRAACCCSWQCQAQSVNVRMAKAQDMSLNQVAINGTCGRLKCCLRFEYEQYRTEGMRLPEQGSIVRCGADGAEGMVVGRNVMKGRLTVRMRDGRCLTVDADSVMIIRAAVPREDDGRRRESTHEDPAGEWA